jgi:hypothetical protein
MNLAIGVSGLSPKAFNRSSAIDEQCPQLRHSTTIRFIPGMWARTASRQRGVLSCDVSEYMSALPPKADVRCNYGCPLWANSGHRGKLFDHVETVPAPNITRLGAASYMNSTDDIVLFYAEATTVGPDCKPKSRHSLLSRTQTATARLSSSLCTPRTLILIRSRLKTSAVLPCTTVFWSARSIC